MLIAGRNGMAVKPKWKNPYVTDGLLAMWDGEWNAGGGVHDVSATTWADLSGNGNDFAMTAGTWAADHLVCSGASGSMSHYIDGIATIEFVGRRTSTARYQMAVGLALRTTNANYGRYVAYSDNTVNFSSQYPRLDSPVNELASIATDFTNLYKNGVIATSTGTGDFFGGSTSSGATIGITTLNRYPFGGEIYAIRLYSRALTADEIAANYAVDKTRFNLP